MTTTDRRAKVTPETRAEAKRLRELWDTRSHPSQAEFGEIYGIGNQSAVGQFLRGVTPLSLKAAQGFARGLDVALEEFSPRLAKKAAEIASMAPADGLSAEVMNLAREIESLRGRQRARILRVLRDSLSLAQHGAGDDEDQAQRKSG